MKTYSIYEHTSPDGRVYIGITSQKPKEFSNKPADIYGDIKHERQAKNET